MKQWKRWVALALTVIMTMGLIPSLAVSAAALSVDTESAGAGLYVPAKPGGMMYSSMIMNGAVQTSGGQPVTPTTEWNCKWECKDKGTREVGEIHNTINPDGAINLAVDQSQAPGMGKKVSDYNMMGLFGVQKTVMKGLTIKNTYVQAPAPGFYTGARNEDHTYNIADRSNWNAVYVEPNMAVNNTTSSDDSRKKDYPISIGLKGTGDNDDGYDARRDFWGDVVIDDNPTLKALAESGSLYFNFSSLLLGAKQARKAKSDEYTEVAGYVLVYHNVTSGIVPILTADQVESKSIRSSLSGYATWDDPFDVRNNPGRYPNCTMVGFCNGTTLDRTTKSVNTGWIKLNPHDVIRLQVIVPEHDGPAQASSVGFANSVLLFADLTCPTVSDTIKMEAVGAYNYNASNQRDEVLLRQNSRFSMDVNFSENVASNLTIVDGQTSSDNYQLLDQLANYKLFTNPLSTGAKRSGETVYMKLTSAPTIGERGNPTFFNSADPAHPSEAQQVAGLRKQFSSLHYEWNATVGDFSNGNPVPYDDLFNDSNHLKNNDYSLFEKIALASLHDLAGNPLKGVDGNPIMPGSNKGYEDAIGHADVKIYGMTDDGKKSDKVAKHIGYESSTDYREFKNPFSTLDFKIDAIAPTYSVTSNGFQPEILTDLALNKGDSFKVTANFSEAVMVKRFDSDGKATNWKQSDTYLTFNNGIEGSYYGLGNNNDSSKWVFSVNIDGNTASEIKALDVVGLNHRSAGKDDTYVLTDEVGNAVQLTTNAVAADQNATQKKSIKWAKLQVDNTAPVITVVDDEDASSYIITAKDDVSERPASGIFKPGNASAQYKEGSDANVPEGDGSGEVGGLVYYTYMHGDTETVQAKLNEMLAKNKFAEVKKYSLTGIQPTEFELHALNNGSALPYGKDGDTLVIFAADMTWDSARQLKQYEAVQSARTEFAQDYLGKVAEELANTHPDVKNLVGDAYTVLNSEQAPDDWDVNYTAYFENKSGGWSHIEENPKYPVFKKDGTFFKEQYTLLGSIPDNWLSNYTDYYLDDGNDGYANVPKVPDWPAFAENTYYKYVDYELVSDEEKPANFSDLLYPDSKDPSGYRALRTSPEIQEFQAGKTYKAEKYLLAWTITDVAEPTEIQVNNQIQPTPDYKAELRLLKKLDGKPDDIGTAEHGKYYIAASATEKIGESKFDFITEQFVSLPRRYDVKDEVVYIECEPANADSRDYYEVYQTVTLEGADETLAASEVYKNVYREEQQKEMEDGALTTALIQVHPNIKMIGDEKDLPIKTLDGAASLYYVELGAALSEVPEDWMTAYGDYCVRNDAEDITYVKNTSTTVNEDAAYYRLDPATGILNFVEPNDEDQQADWKLYATKYYYIGTVKTHTEYEALTEAVGYAPGKYYKYNVDHYECVDADEPPVDWETAPGNYYICKIVEDTLPGEELDQVTTLEPDVYEPDVYYQYRDAYDLLDTVPNDWSSAEVTGDSLRYGYENYFIKSEDGSYVPVPKQTPPAFEADTYYKWEYIALEEQPDDWKEAFKQYAVKENGEIFSLNAIDLRQWENEKRLEFTSDPVPYVKDTFATASDQMKILAAVIEEGERRDEFEKQITEAATNADRITVLQAYSEFADAIAVAEKWLLTKAGDYENWATTKFTEADSNWSYYIQSPLDTEPPAVEFGELINNGTSGVKAEITVTDMTAPLTVKYAFVKRIAELAADEQPQPDATLIAAMKDVPTKNIDEDISLYTIKAPNLLNGESNNGYLWEPVSDGQDGYTFKSISEEVSDEFVLWIFTEDATGKPNHSTLIPFSQEDDEGGQSVCVLRINQVNNMAVTPFTGDAGKSDRFFHAGEQVTGITALASGSMENEFLVEKDPKIYYFVSKVGENAPEDLSEWTLLNDEGILDEEAMTRTYTIPAFTETETGKYCVNVKCKYDGGATAIAQTDSIKFDCDAPLVTFNQVTNTKERVAYTVTAKDDSTNKVESGMEQLQYQWFPGAPQEGAWEDVTTGQILSYDLTTVDTVTLYIRATDKAGNVSVAQRVCGNKVQPVAAPTPTGELLAVEETEAGKYAVVELDLGENKPEQGATYSYAITAQGDTDVWSRWMPYESIVRVNMGESTDGKTLKMKFRSSSGAISATEKTVVISDFTAVNDEPYATVVRSTLNRTKTVDLTFLTKEGCTVQNVTDNSENLTESGVFTFTIEDSESNVKTLDVAVNNITTEPPEYDYRFSTSELTNCDVQLTMVNMAEDVSVKSVEFTSEKTGETVSMPADQIVSIPENGTLTMTLVDTAGNEVTFYPTVNWIDKSLPEVKAEIVYEYTDGGDTVSCLYKDSVSEAAFIKLTAQDDKAFSVNRASNGMNPIFTAEDGKTIVYMVTENRDDYRFTVANTLGTTDTVSATVNTIVAYPTIREVSREVKNGKVFITYTGSVDTVRGQIVKCNGKDVKLGADNTYTYEESYGSNGKFRVVVQDQLEQQTVLYVTVSGLDDIKPTLSFTGGLMMTVNDSVETVLTNAYKAGNIKISDVTRDAYGNQVDVLSPQIRYLSNIDDTVNEGELGLFLATLSSMGTTAYNSGETGSRQAYLVAKDAAGNQTKIIINTAVMPTSDEMVITADGILVSSDSSVVPIVDDDTVTVQIRGFKNMKYGKEETIVENKAGTYDLFIQKGLYREGILKTVHSVYLKNNAEETIQFSPKAADERYRLDGSGWYTIVVRNSERETEYTTFFVSADTPEEN